MTNFSGLLGIYLSFSYYGNDPLIFYLISTSLKSILFRTKGI